MNTAKQTALITGASGGIGYELAKIFAAKGWDLVLVARNAEALQAIANDLALKHGVSVSFIPKDLARPGACMELYNETTRLGVAIDALVNNAGFGTSGAFTKTDLVTELDLIQVNITALTHLTKLYIHEMAKRGHGKILNVASTAAFQPGPLMAVYYASKAYVLSFSEALSNEMIGSGVTVTALCPGPTRTGFQARASAERSGLFRRAGVMNPDAVARAGYEAMMRGSSLSIPGTFNKVAAWSMRFIPRTTAASIVRNLHRETS